MREVPGNSGFACAENATTCAQETRENGATAKTTTTDQDRRIGELEDELKQRDRRIAELIEERDKQRDLINRFREYAEDHTNIIEAWRGTFGMELTDDGCWMGAVSSQA